jgi:hypothetical protein
MSHDWEAHRDTLEELYLNKGMALKDIITYMKDTLEFRAT